MKYKIGVVHGKFQGFHLGHMEYVLASFEHCEHLIIGITNPDPDLTKKDSSDIKRSLSESNPFTYYERYIMIRDSLVERNISKDNFDIVPFPINFPDKLYLYAPSDAVYFTTIYDEWNRKKIQVLKNLGLKVNILWERTMEDRLTSGTELRDKIKHGLVWEYLVPKAVERIIKENKLDKKLQSLR